MKPSNIFISVSSIITVFCSEGVHLSKDNQVSQTPAEVLTRPNVQVNLSFTHTIQNYNTILWYQRPAGDTGLKLIGYVFYKTPTVESAFKEAFAVSGDGEKAAHLHILGHPEDSTEYYGAASVHSWQERDSVIQKAPEQQEIKCTPTGNSWKRAAR
ncbi:hypothetical protein D4764_16G0010530 [Takifugu flavidus]|uniref:Immunoglobulin V-set domain-containing protein n=1 Tax=Takifugu flavidus TaxID=433684 RepID=A0A5C6P0H3_9TELE|nr:hypothetical protein D4764_16G0010530 [Takifugu flavidus]